MKLRPSRVGLVVVTALVSSSACTYHPPHPGISISMSKVTADVLYGGAAAAVLPGALPLPPLPRGATCRADPVRAIIAAHHIDAACGEG